MDFLRSQLVFISSQFTTLPYPTASFSGQTIIVTGSNTGLGLEGARHFARLDAAKVILAVRSVAKGEEAAKSIHDSIGKKDVCEVWEVDMGDWKSIQSFAKKVEGLERLDIVVENAGIATSTYSLMEGTESTIAVNVIGTFLMALLLLPILRRMGTKFGIEPTLAITSSEVHAWTPFSERLESSIFDALKQNNPKYMGSRYQTSKLLEVLMVRELDEHMRSGAHASEPVVLNCSNPGLCYSSLTREAKGVQGVILAVMKTLLARTTEVGGRTLVAAGSAGKESTGQYLSNCKVAAPSTFVTSKEGKQAQARVYSELIAILENIEPGISKNI